jgi:tyrosine phenol-lyase
MNDSSRGVMFSVPYEIAVVRPLRQTTIDERAAALRAAYYNTELIPQDLIYIDLATDSGVSAFSTNQFAALIGATAVEPGMGLAAEGSRAFGLLSEQVQKNFGIPYIVPTTQGRSAERIWTKIHVKPGSVVAGNMLFPSTRNHIEMNGAKIVDVIGDAAHDLTANQPFKGDMDLTKLEAVIQQHGAAKVSCIYVELSVNACGGHPVSLANLKAVKAIASANKIPLFLDACRILENSCLIKERETGYQGHSIGAIVREICAHADGATLSALKDFLVSSGGMILTRDKASQQKAFMQSFLDGVQPSGSAMEMTATVLKEIFSSDAYVRNRVEQVEYLWRALGDDLPVLSPHAGHAVFIDAKRFLPDLPAEQFPAEALAAFTYQMTGIRMTKGPPLAPSQIERGTELLRLAVPARKYLLGHMDDIAATLRYVYENRSEIKGLKKIDDPSRWKYDPAHFTPL